MLEAADVAVDFTVPQITTNIVKGAVDQRTPLVCGVTGLDHATTTLISRAAGKIPLLYDRNMSRGIAVMSILLQQAAKALGDGFQVGIQETHHVHKKDAPSGTAIALREALGDDSIKIDSRREGEIIGDHLVRFGAANERIDIAHSVSDRRVFAEGAIAAARWLHDQPPGLYRMTDIWSHG